MAPIEPDLSNSNIKALLGGSAYFTTTTSLLALIGYRVFYRAHVSLPPSQSVRNKQHDRRNHEKVFASLAGISLAVAGYYGFKFLLLSYQIWAYERGEVFPTGFTRDGGLLASNGPALLLGRWYRDTDLTGEFWEIAMEKTRRRWWTNQLILSTTAWSLYVAVKGRAHGIPHLWAFIALAPLLSLSFAMNLFFVALLLTPLPIPHDATAVVPVKTRGRKTTKAIESAAASTVAHADSFLGKLSGIRDHWIPPKPQTWTPHPLVSLVPLLLTLVHTVLLSFASNTTSFHSLLNLLLLDIFLPVLLPVLIPESWGSTSASRHHHTASLTTFSLLNLAVHIFTTFIALLYNDPGAHRHRHSVLFFRHDDDRSRATRTATALARILGAIDDHPAVGKIGSDVLLSSISLAIWAAVRGIEPSSLLRAAGWATKAEIKAVKHVKDRVVDEVSNLISSAADEDEVEEPASPTPVRRRIRRAKAIEEGEATGEKGVGAETYQPAGEVVRGEEVEDVDVESGALAWGIMVLGGLGSGVAAVLGGDIGL